MALIMVSSSAIHLEEAESKTCLDCHINFVHRRVPGERIFRRTEWNRMIEVEFDLEPGSAERLLNEKFIRPILYRRETHSAVKQQQIRLIG
jgi:hypothetical protein